MRRILIYFLLDPKMKTVKIGTTRELSVRLPKLINQTARTLVLLGAMDGGRDRERALHGEFSRFWVAGEWFSFSKEIEQFIKKECREWDGTNEPRARVKVAIQVTPEYKAWLDAFADAQRDIPSRMIDLGLIELAKKLGHELPPKR